MKFFGAAPEQYGVWQKLYCLARSQGILPGEDLADVFERALRVSRLPAVSDANAEKLKRALQQAGYPASFTMQILKALHVAFPPTDKLAPETSSTGEVADTVPSGETENPYPPGPTPCGHAEFLSAFTVSQQEPTAEQQKYIWDKWGNALKAMATGENPPTAGANEVIQAANSETEKVRRELVVGLAGNPKLMKMLEECTTHGSRVRLVQKWVRVFEDATLKHVDIPATIRVTPPDAPMEGVGGCSGA